MEERRWEEMERDCLVNIFARLGLDDLTLGVPFVCKPWYRATLDPLCWRVLDFRALDFMPWSGLAKRFTALYSPSRFSFGAFMKLVIGRSHGSTIELRFHMVFGSSLEDLVYASHECPRLKVLALPNLKLDDEVHIPELTARWKDLERLEMQSKPSCFQELATQISLNCNKLVGLRVSGGINKEDASAITNHLPKLKYLDLSKSYLPREQLFSIINGCKELERLIVRDCVGFDGEDEVILRGASRIKTFEHQGSKLQDDTGYETDECDPLCYVQVI